MQRRIWLILAVGVPLSVLVAVVVMKQKSVYRAMADITIDPPQFDQMLSTLVSHSIGARDPEFAAKYVPNRIAMLRSRALAEEVLSDPSLTQNSVPSEDAVVDLVTNLQTRQIPNSNRFQVSLEGTDPARTASFHSRARYAAMASANGTRSDSYFGLFCATSRSS